MGKTEEVRAAALVVLARMGVPPDVQELLMVGDPARRVRPGALEAALEEVRVKLPDGSLLDHLEDGDAAAVKGPSGWDVALFERGAMHRIRTIACDMDKSVAYFLAQAIRAVRG